MTSRDWSFFNPVRLVFGAGALDSLATALAEDHAIVVTTPGWVRRGLARRLADLYGRGQDVVVYDGVKPNPEIDDVQAAARDIRARGGGDCIVALGGGSAIDVGKALSVLLADPTFSLRHHLERGTPLPVEAPLPVYAIPTTAGTGSEVTPFATLWDGTTSRKHSLSDPRLFPRFAVLAPELTVGLPHKETVCSGLDALSQGLEAIWNRHANPVSTSFARSAVGLALEFLPRVVQDPESVELRARMLEASLLAGLAISSTRTALAHSMSYPLTAHFGVPHGLACGFTLPALCRFNMAVDDGRLGDLAAFLGLAPDGGLPGALLDVLREVDVGSLLRQHVPALEAAVGVADEMLSPGRADNNMRPAGADDVIRIVSEAWHDVAVAPI